MDWSNREHKIKLELDKPVYWTLISIQKCRNLANIFPSIFEKYVWDESRSKALLFSSSGRTVKTISRKNQNSWIPYARISQGLPLVFDPILRREKGNGKNMFQASTSSSEEDSISCLSRIEKNSSVTSVPKKKSRKGSKRSPGTCSKWIVSFSHPIIHHIEHWHWTDIVPSLLCLSLWKTDLYFFAIQ